jgi:hypothetical protein
MCEKEQHNKDLTHRQNGATLTQKEKTTGCSRNEDVPATVKRDHVQRSTREVRGGSKRRATNEADVHSRCDTVLEERDCDRVGRNSTFTVKIHEMRKWC